MNGTHLTHRVFAFIQARSGSTRLPGKVLRPFSGSKTILDLIFERVRMVLPEERIYLLLPEGDLPLQEFARQRNLRFFTGSELDVRDRFLQAAEHVGADWILRLTGDNPFLDLTHLELLLESIRFTDADVLSFSGLPLGATGEVIRTSAMAKEPQSGLEDRHREHVSLHLKEYPEEYRFIKLNPFLEADEIDICKEIRITIDEEKDWDTCQIIHETLKMENFGTRELIGLYRTRPDIFKKNKQVEQVSFSIPENSQKDRGRIGITYAPVMEHGSGHLARMRILSVYLQSLGFDVELRDAFNGIELDLEILDYRDTELPPSYSPEKWVKLDNFGSLQGKETFFFSLPHPKLALSDYSEHIFISHAQETNRQNPKREKQGICIYAGGLDEKASEYLDTWAAENFPSEPITRIGGMPPVQEGIKYTYRLTSHLFSRMLCESRVFITYFGQSLLEGLYLGAECYCYSISSYHEELSQFSRDVFGVSYLGNVFLQSLDYNAPESKPGHSELIGEGFHRLIHLVKNKLGKKYVS